MTQPTDEMLVAFVDGELSPEDAAAVELALKSDQRVREAVQVFRESADWSRRAYDEVLHEPVPERLIHAAFGNGRVESDGPVPTVPRTDGMPRRRVTAMAMAASVALAIGLGGGFGLFQFFGAEDGTAAQPLLVGPVDPSGVLHSALDSAASGMVIATQGGGNVMPLTTFVDRSGRFCREFQAVTASPDSLRATFAIACHQPTGSWQIEAVGAAPAPDPAGSDRYQWADGSAVDPLQALIEAMSDQGPISLEDEASHLLNGWQ